MIKDEAGTFFEQQNRMTIARMYPPDFSQAPHKQLGKKHSATDEMIMYYIKNAGRVI